MITKLERVEKDEAYINFSQKAHNSKHSITWKLPVIFPFFPLFNQLCRPLHDTENEVISTDMCKLITSSKRLFVRVISFLQALWSVHRNIFSHLAFRCLIKAMQFKNGRAPSQQKFVVNPFPLRKACDSSELPGMPFSRTATFFTVLSTGDNHNQQLFSRNTRIQML